MLSNFDKFATIAVDEGYATSTGGLSLLYDLFKHLSDGGTVHNFKSDVVEGDEIVAILATAWNGAREFADVVDELNEEGLS